jgi:hypothetical protein
MCLAPFLAPFLIHVPGTVSALFQKRAPLDPSRYHNYGTADLARVEGAR